MENFLNTNFILKHHGFYPTSVYDNCEYDDFKRAAYLLNPWSVIPVFNVITGLVKLINGIAGLAFSRKTTKLDCLGLALRGVTEILFGPLLLISDLAIRYLRLKNEPKSHSDCSELIAVKA